MLNLIVPLIAGLLLGYLLRDRKRFNLSKVTFGAIVALIFSLGFSIGSNNELLASIPVMGLDALIIVLLAVFFSVVFVKAARKMVKLE